MINYTYGDFWTFMHDNDARVYRMWKIKKSWTPWEQEHCGEFDTNLEDATADTVLIREAIELPNGDVLLGVQVVDDDYDDTLDMSPEEVYMEYVKLSEIELAYSPVDQFGYEKDEE